MLDLNKTFAEFNSRRTEKKRKKEKKERRIKQGWLQFKRMKGAKNGGSTA
jgi:hypothetical protein